MSTGEPLMVWLTANWKIVVAVLAGAAVVFIVGITTENTAAILFTGLAVGILVGGLVSAMSRGKDRRR
jgi:hypothetical protein